MSQPQVAFRTDASLDIGAGHVMRCLTLADALSNNGAHCFFICRAHAGSCPDVIQQRGYEVRELPVPCQSTEEGSVQAASLSGYASWLGANWETDAEQTLSAIGDSPLDWLVVDHYAIDAQWELELAGACQQMMVIDDLADRAHNCDLLLDQNLGRQDADYQGLVSPECTLLIGLDYALLRPEFVQLRVSSLQRRKAPEFKHLLISMGGVDKDNVTCDVLDALVEFPLPPCMRISVVMGAHAPWLQRVREKAQKIPCAVDVLVNISDMAGLMSTCDLAIGAAGSASWERCALGLPAYVVILADNQRASCLALVKEGAVELLDSGAGLRANLRDKIEGVMTDPSILRRMSGRAAQVCDGGGVMLVSRQLLLQDQTRGEMI